MPRKAQLPDPLLEAFLRVAEKIDIAQRALLIAIPTSRDPGAPLDVALEAFEASLGEARALMPTWAHDPLREMNASCVEAIDTALKQASALKGATLQFEALNARIGDVLHPLERFVDAERFLRKRKRRIT
ncbi:MAG: hypothetical protein ACYDCC_13130 [Actinomycetota bacterium]